MMSNKGTTAASLVLTISITLANLLIAGESPRSELTVTTKRADDQVAISKEGNTAVVQIRSPYGISRATIERTGDKWPACVVLKLHVKGLERLRLVCGKTTLQAAVSIQDEQPSVRLWKDQAEDAPLDPHSPYWIKVRVLESDGSPAKNLPLKNGVFLLTLPGVLLEDNPKSITVEWIDFYRG